MSDIRTEVAMIIDPDVWNAKLKTTFHLENGRPYRILGEGQTLADFEAQVALSLAKADTIIQLVLAAANS